jgi:hypothetical protein
MTIKTNIRILSIISIFLILATVTDISAVTGTKQNSGLTGLVTTTSNLGVFYYPWAGGASEGYRHWIDNGHNPPKTWFGNYLPDYVNGFNPSQDLYSSKDENITKWNLELMKRAGIGFVISSWWGQNSYEDQALDIIFNKVLPAADNPYPDVKFAIYYEKEGFADVPESEIVSDINYIKSKYANSSYYYNIGGKPVVFVYNADAGGLADAQKWKQVRDETGIYVVLKVFSGYQSNLGLADSWHQYAPTTPYEAQGNYSAFISPGYHKGDEAVRLERENFTRFENNVISLKNANVQFKLIETWDEWGEGTGIGPAQLINHNDTGIFTQAAPSYGTRYIDTLGKYFSSELIIKGDINHDGVVTVADALLYLRYSVGQNILPFHIYQTTDDVTCEGTTTVADALKVLRKAVGQNVSLDC